MDGNQIVPSLLQTNAVFALFENTQDNSNTALSYLFVDPVGQIVANDKNEIQDALNAIDVAKRGGQYLAGYITYEAGYHIVDKHDFSHSGSSHSNKLPLVDFYIFSKCVQITREDADRLLDNTVQHEMCAVYDFELSETKQQYIANLSKIHRYIMDGDTYQVNHTLKSHFKYEGSPLALYQELRDRQPVQFAAFLNFPESYVLSLSPELFIRKTGGCLEAKPMKGTAHRGSTDLEDELIARSLRNDPKTQSENVMIVDLVRNDIGRIAKAGSVRVENLFEVQTFKTLHQMISTIKGEVDENIPISDVIKNLFPCGSVTGAPKIRTMEIIEKLESEDRGIYTGAIGYITPDNDFCFNVPIRTIVSPEKGIAEMGIGGGIIFEANAENEYKECLLKSKFLTDINDRFQLIEAILYNADTRNYINLKQHLNRLKASASTFGFVYDSDVVQSALIDAAENAISGLYKSRLLLYNNGEVSVSITKLELHNPAKRHILISQKFANSNSIFLYHKTTMRREYEEAYDQAIAKGAYDVVFFNESGQVTEASRHNLFIKKDGQLYTPPIKSGLLPGIFREIILADNRYSVIENELYYEDLIGADHIYLTNAIRGLVEVDLRLEEESVLYDSDIEHSLLN